jgi:ribonuclease III
MNDAPDIQHLQETIGYLFENKALLEEALRHSSYVNEQPDTGLRDNERMEFLGDAVLNLTIGDLLMQTYPELHEGDLSRIRANLVNETQLAEIARELNLGGYILLGKGETQTHGHDKNSILANAFEALCAAVYFDKGFSAAFAIIQNLFKDLLIDEGILTAGQDFKSRLQEAVQGSYKAIPIYEVMEEIGPDHDKTFRVGMTVGDLKTEGTGKSKKTAEQDAARRALVLIEREMNIK